MLLRNSTFPLLLFLSDGNTEVKDERCPFIRAVLRQFTGEELRNNMGKLSIKILVSYFISFASLSDTPISRPSYVACFSFSPKITASGALLTNPALLSFLIIRSTSS